MAEIEYPGIAKLVSRLVWDQETDVYKSQVMDCTLRDGANVVGKGFDAELTKLMIEGMIESGITTIEMGNCLGLGAYEANGAIAPCTDVEYLELIQPYLSKAEIGMFFGYKNVNEANVALAKKYGLKFLRVGANAGEDVYKRQRAPRVPATTTRTSASRWTTRSASAAACASTRAPTTHAATTTWTSLRRLTTKATR